PERRVPRPGARVVLVYSTPACLEQCQQDGVEVIVGPRVTRAKDVAGPRAVPGRVVPGKAAWLFHRPEPSGPSAERLRPEAPATPGIEPGEQVPARGHGDHVIVKAKDGTPAPGADHGLSSADVFASKMR